MTDTLATYSTPVGMTDPGRYGDLFASVPQDVAGVAHVAQGLIVHEFMAEAYGRDVTDEERSSVHVRRVEDLVGRIVAIDDAPLTQRRPPSRRVIGNCRHFSVLTVAMLRAHGTPARARCGFGDYFLSRTFEDHWVAEYWDASERRWLLADAQIDRRQQSLFPIDFDVLDVPRDRFLVAGDAWRRCRAGTSDPATFGLSFTQEFGLWWIAGNLMRDAAALVTVELLPWDAWGAMPGPQDAIDDGLSDLLDQLAAATIDPDTRSDVLHALMRDDRLRLPEVVRNCVLARDEPIAT